MDEIDLEVEAGEIFGFLGPNGAGKTTTIKMLNTLVRPTSGTALIDGKDILKDPAAVRTVIGYVGQELGIDEYATGKENLMLFAHLYRLRGATLRERIREIFDLVDLTGQENRMVSTYSGGMRKRLDIAMGLIHRPKIIFLDEPTVGLDPQTRAHIWDYVRDLARLLGITIFMTTHYMDEADHLAGRIAIIDKGKIIAVGTPAELKQSISGDVVLVSPCATKDDDCREFIGYSQKVLEGQPFVLATQPMDRDVAIYVAKSETAVPDILRLLTSAGLMVKTISFSQPTLDDVFLKYTGRTMRNQEGMPELPNVSQPQGAGRWR